MHPYHHAQSSQAIWGGDVTDYLPLHNWFDQTKTTLAHANHRALRHHSRGVDIALIKFTKLIKNKDGVIVPVQDLCHQHLMEDCSRIPNIEDWLDCLELPNWMPQTPMDWQEIIESEARIKQIDPQTLIPLAQWFSQPQEWYGGPASFSIRHHSFGIFEAEEWFGSTVQCGNDRVPTRYLAERIVRKALGRIPAPSDWLRKIKTQRWMVDASKPSMVLQKNRRKESSGSE